jgi:ElaA protein
MHEKKQLFWAIKAFNELDNYQLFQMYKLRTAVFVIEQNCPYQEVDDKDLSAIHVLGYVNNKLVAYSRILPPGISYDEVSIGRVVVDKNFRKFGYGRDLMLKTTDIIYEKWGNTAIRISAQTYLKSFYESLGFIQQKEEYLEDGIPHIEMLKVNNSY